MRNVFVILLINCSALISNAQNWCTPNSEWHYNRISILGPAYTRINYTGTTTVNSFTCQQLDYFSEVYQYPAGTTFTHASIPYYTYEYNNVVFLYNQINQQFDTLYNYNASIGDQWLLPANYSYTFLPTCNKSPLTVLDTGHATIQGLNLKWLKVQIGSSYVPVDTIFQRFGFLNNYFMNYDNCPDYTYHAQKGGTLRCFSDNKITNYNRTAKPCNDLYFPLSVEKGTLSNNIKTYPNPVYGALTIEALNNNIAAYTYSLFTIIGQEQTIETKQQENKLLLNTNNMNKGIYFLHVFNKDKLIHTKKIIKE
jgi:hypothetical protein